MDIPKILSILRQEREDIETAIRSLENDDWKFGPTVDRSATRLGGGFGRPATGATEKARRSVIEIGRGKPGRDEVQ